MIEVLTRLVSTTKRTEERFEMPNFEFSELVVQASAFGLPVGGGWVMLYNILYRLFFIKKLQPFDFVE